MNSLNKKKLFKLFKLYLHYITIPFRILFIIVTYFILLFILVIINDRNIDNNLIYYANKILMLLLSVNIIYDKDNLEILNKYINSDTKFIIIFNHTNLIEPFLLLSLFKNISFLLNPELPSYLPFFDVIYKKFNFIYTKNGNTTDKIINYTNDRKNGESALAIAPGEGRPSDNPDENNITKFKSGAFVGLLPILPIVIKFEDVFVDYNFDKGEYFLHALLKIFLKQKHNVKVKVLELVHPNKNESINDYKDRIRDIMSKEYNKYTKM